MRRYFLKQVLSSLPTLVGVTFLAFVLIRLVPGDPVTLILGDRGAAPEVAAEMRAQLGLDQPWLVQYGAFVWRALHGDLGTSIHSRRPIWEEFKDRFPATVELSGAALGLAILVGIPLGVLAAVKRGSLWDGLSMGGSLVGYSMPIFWWGLILILVFSVKLGWTPVSGRMSAYFDIESRSGFMLLDAYRAGWPAFKEALRHLCLPTLALATVPTAAIARMTRATMIEVLREDYIRTAKAKGLSRRQVIFRHGLRNALLPIVTVVGLMGSSLLTGAILTETIFAWPGVGRWMVTSVASRDYPVLQGGLLLICGAVIAVHLMIEVLYFILNPLVRGRHENEI